MIERDRTVFERRPSVEELVAGIMRDSPMKSGPAKDAAGLHLTLCMRERERLSALSESGEISVEEAVAANANIRTFLSLIKTLGVDGKKDPDDDVDFGGG